MNRDREEDSDIAKVLGVQSSSTPKGRFKFWLGWGAILPLIALAIFYWNANSRVNPIQFKTQAARRGDLTVTVTATGTLEPTKEVSVGSELSGIIESVEADYNDQVKIGQILVRMDRSKLNAEVMKSSATLAAAKGKVLQVEATLAESRNNLGRIKQSRKLTNNKVPSREVLDTAEAAFQRAKADLISSKAGVTEAQAILDSDQADLSKAVIRSPINGVVLTRSADPGQTVAAAMQAPVLFTLAQDLTKMELHVDVDEADVSLVKEGQSAKFTVDAYQERIFPATISQVRYGAQTTDGVVTYKTILSVNNSELLLRPGMTATADITVKKITDSILVPNGALRFTPPVSEGGKRSSQSGGFISRLLPGPPHRKPSPKSDIAEKQDSKRQHVWIINSSGEAVQVPIKTGETDGTMTEVLSGAIQPDMMLIVDTVSVDK